MSTPTPASNDSQPNHSFTLPEEQLVELITSTGLTVRLACSPYHLAELATGWLFTQNLINGADDIHSLQVCDQNVRILVQVKPCTTPASLTYAPVMTSGCSGGVANLEQYQNDLKLCDSTQTISLTSVRELLSEMFAWLHAHAVYGGLHCAALAPINGGPMLLANDIGRHNAVDKVIGMALQSRLDFGSQLLATSGRISSDMLLKAARAGIPIVATARSATSLAAHLAEASAITVVCRLGKSKPLILGNTARIRS